MCDQLEAMTSLASLTIPSSNTPPHPIRLPAPPGLSQRILRTWAVPTSPNRPFTPQIRLPCDALLDARYMYPRRLFQLWPEAMAPRRYRPGRVGLRRPCEGIWWVGRGRNTVAGNVWASP